MNPARWQKLKGLVADALELEPSQRASFIEQSCGDDAELRGEVESLLVQSGARVENFAEDLNSTIARTEESSRTGERLGTYEIIREMGRGGMGAVYLARRADETFEKQVAIKILKRGTDTDEVLRRFRAERQILARLDHPNIARLLDAGTTDDGLPYFVMERVEGVPITDFCNERGLTSNQRIRLFLQVGEAIQFAHRNLIVHRDIKPGNILVTAEGQPKLLDFGIAKLLETEGETVLLTIESRQRLTPGYASPEQVRGEAITTVSDVYSLGALLFELLTGKSPHRFTTSTPSPTELHRVIGEQEIARTDLPSDLDNILRTALRKEPERRYSGVTALTDDLRRYLEGRPVRARPLTFGYRAAKFLARNKLGAAAAILLLASLLGGIAATTWQARKAERRFEQVRKLARSVIFDYYDPIASLPGSTAVRERLVKDALEYLDNLAAEETGDANLLRELASAYQRVGQIQGNSYYSNLGNPTAAMKSYRESLALREKLLASRPTDPEIRHEIADSHEGIGDIFYTLGDLRAGLASYEEAFKVRQPLVANNPSEMRFAVALAQLYTRFSDIYGLEGYANLGDTGAALAYYRKSYEILEPLAAARPDDYELQKTFANGVVISAMFARSAGRANEALATAERGLALMRKIAKAEDQDSTALLLRARAVLRYTLVDNNRLEEAIAISREVIAGLEEMVRADPKNNQFRRNLGVTHNALGKDLVAAGRIPEALEHYRTALQIGEAAFADDPNSEDNKSDIAFTCQQLGQAQSASGEEEAALENFRRALALREPSLLADPSNARVKEDVATLEVDLAKALAQSGILEAAIETFGKAIPVAQELAAADPSHAGHRARLAETHFECGRVHLQRARVAEGQGTSAEDARKQAQEHLSRSLGLWRELRERGSLIPANGFKMTETEKVLAESKAL